MSYFEFPHTRTYDSDLGWLIEEYKVLETHVNELLSWMATHKTEYEEALARLVVVENEISTFETTITAAFNTLKSQIEADFEEQKELLRLELEETKAEVDAEIALMIEQVNAAIAGFENRFGDLETSIENEITQLKAEVRNEVDNFYNTMLANNEYVFNRVETRLEEFINSLPEILTVNVYNPYRGEVTDIQTAIYDLYEVASIWALTAQQYDSLGLTASDYDSLDLTARQYDTLGYKLLYKDPNYYMISPFTGELTHITDIISKLAMFHMEGLTATEYDSKELTAEYYDETLSLTAFNYDWFAATLIA